MSHFPEFQTAFREIQEETNFRPAALAAAVGVARSQIFRWLSGDTTPGKASLRRLLRDFRYVRDGQMVALDAEAKTKLILAAGYHPLDFDDIGSEIIEEVTNCTLYSARGDSHRMPDWSYHVSRAESTSVSPLDVMGSYLNLARPIAVTERLIRAHGYRQEAARSYALALESDYQRLSRSLRQGLRARFLTSRRRFLECFPSGVYDCVQLTREEVSLWASRLARMMERPAALQIRLSGKPLPRHLALCGDAVLLYRFDWPLHASARDGCSPIGIRVGSAGIVQRFRQRFDTLWHAADNEDASQQLLTSLV